ncbi:hypothetical protein F4819DRAFT_492366 [Hypoxylon fuscum]|nr:hypothetical protein F4819DRAFT_492366 [Hypoxylon fuscum]
MGFEVGHIGIWDGNLPGLSKRDPNAIPRHVFGTNIHGRDYHFTYMGIQSNNTYFRIGFGPGPRTSKNERRLSAREDTNYNQQHFDGGGIDFSGLSDPAFPTGTGQSPVAWMDPKNATEFDWIVQQVACYMSSFSFLFGSPMAQGALNFQVYNYIDHETLSAGSMAPFSGDTQSAIAQTQIKGGIPENHKCTTS